MKKRQEKADKEQSSAKAAPAESAKSGARVSTRPEIPDNVKSSLAKAKEFTRRHLLELGLGGAFAVVAIRLGWLQTVKTGAYASAAKTERTANITMPYRRGAIYERNGILLAQSVDATTVYANPKQIKTADINATANTLSEILGGSATAYAALISDNTLSFVYVEKRVDPAVAEKLKTRLSELKLGGISYLEDSRRVYPLGEVAGNLIGCVGEEGKGLTGLELYYDDLLTGTDGSLIEERSRDGAPVVGGQSERVDPIDGTNIVISIDVDIQRTAQETLTSTIDEWNCGDGVAIVMHPETGEILACASTPFLDPSRLDLATSDALKLRGITDSYEPGSTTKPLTASMAIDLGIATPDTVYPAPAKIQVGDSWVGDADARADFIEMTLTQVLERSSNVGAVLCAESVGAEHFSQYLTKYGVGTATGIDYPGEATGIVPELKDYSGAWQFMAFGQSFAVPPIQMARAVGAIANEGVPVQPHFLISKGGEEVTYERGERVIATATAEQVDWMMNSVVVNGYGRTGAIDGYNLSAKTGTSERLDPNTGAYAKDSFTVSFMGFGPTEDPKALVYILFDEVDMAHQGTSAGAPWAAIMQETLTKLDIAPSW